MTQRLTARQLAIAHLASATGCTNGELAATLGWQQASVRCLMTSLRHEGWPIRSANPSGLQKRYYLKPKQLMATKSDKWINALNNLGLLE